MKFFVYKPGILHKHNKMRFSIPLTMVQFVVEASVLSSVLERNELLTLAYYVDELVRLD